ncbi:MAG: SpoIIE family protein phosphatase [Rhodobacteraceae bacterium]|nr:SpoIIE family protein phosphatase [Paracoccaceae bacterium]MCY4250879.1 SpoIIE family protein phosphatase [Paracoccaceae bacterium]MCY4307050.1 SpoIIE family protein phosphatase [Paracoccaceae bacterium]
MEDTYKLLIVDDEPDLVPLVMQRFRREIRKKTYQFVFAENGVEALDLISADPEIDMVVSDINMPQMDGLTLLRKIPEVNPDLWAIIVSAYGDMKNIRMAMNEGAFDFVVKPIDFEDLKITISRTINHINLWREAQDYKKKLILLDQELQIANKMQQSILPSVLPEGPNFKIFGTMKPARNVGGDFFDTVMLPDNKIAVSIADVSDKGVPAALFMMSSRTLLKGSAISKSDPTTVLEDVNAMLIEDNDAGMFVTLIYGVFNIETGSFVFANGGHNPAILVKEDGNAKYVGMPGGIALGMFPGFSFEDKEITLEKGDQIIFYTDGITEAMNTDGELYGEDRLIEFVQKTIKAGDKDLVSKLVDSVDEFSKGIPQSDDITCLVISYDGPMKYQGALP